MCVFGCGYLKDFGYKVVLIEDSDFCLIVEKIVKIVVSLCDVESVVKFYNIKLYVLCCWLIFK